MNNKISILYVDDEPLNLMLFSINFGNKFNVITAESGSDGLTKLKSGREILIVISDMKMPEMNGIEFIKRAKQEFPSIEFYILTGFDITEEIADALDNKLILKYFRKPFNAKDIEITIQEAL